MVNTINTLTERNKELLTKIEELENKDSSFPSKEQQLKVLDDITKRDISSSISFLKYLGVSETEINLFTESITTTTRVGCGVPYDFRDRENPFKDYFDNFVMRFFNAFEKNARLEKEVKNLKHQKEENETLTKKVAELTESLEKLEKELKEKKLTIENLEVKLEETELKEKTHIEAFEVSERWNKAQKTELIKEYNDCVDLLHETDEIIEDRDNTIRDLQKDLKERQELLDESDEQNEELKRQLCLEKKPLPSLPKRQNKFQQLGTKIKTKFQNLVKKVKHQERELVARIEVNPK